MTYYIKRINVTADRDITLIGKRFRCGDDAEPFDSVKSAESALSRQKKQDEEDCPDCFIEYEAVENAEI